jgi:cytochrome c-type biogenesis protein CcmH/NrfG
VVKPAVPAVEQRLMAAVARQPGSAAAHAALGRYYLQAGQAFEALWELDQASSLAPEDRDTQVDLATALAMGQLYPEAETELEAAARPPPSRVGRRELAALSLAVARPEEAIRALRGAPDLSEWPEGQLLLGRAEEGLGQTGPAREAYQRSIRLAPDLSEGPFRLAHLLLTQGIPGGDPRGARAVLEPALRQWPREARLMQLLAMTYSARWGDREQPDREGQWLTTAMKSGGAVPAQLALGALYLRHERYKEGGAALARLVESSDLPAAHRGMATAMDHLGQPVEAAYHRGMAGVYEGCTDQALREFQAMAARAPDDPRAPQLISQAYAQMDQLNTSLKAAELFYRRGNHSPDMYERLATLYFVTYDRRADRRLCEEWARAQPNSARPLAFLGKISLADLRLSEAARDYQQAAARDPRDVQNLLGLVDALSQQPSPENAKREMALLRQAVAMAPDNAAAHYQLGIRLQQARQWEEARRELLRALDESPAMAAADNNLLQVATALRQPALARRFGSLLRAVQARKREQDAAWKRRWTQPADPEAYVAVARVELRAGRLESAEHQLDRCLELRPGWPDAARLAARVHRLLDGVDADGRRLVSFKEIQ